MLKLAKEHEAASFGLIASFSHKRSFVGTLEARNQTIG
jgi:hypothetical protein